MEGVCKYVIGFLITVLLIMVLVRLCIGVVHSIIKKLKGGA